ncbi:MAG: ribosomal protein S18-alanine N-acetyltransferase [Deltaproteobacteria bacterium]|nr:ribosomal protein S18-alanine N-acetyltransferase [Deltaproteobacteria bacterium]
MHTEEHIPAGHPSGPSGHRILPMSFDDLEDVLRIENLSFPQPWTRGLFEQEMCNPISYALVEKADFEGRQRLGAYTVFWIVAGEGHILNIAVDPELRGMGLARRLLAFILDFMSEKGVSEVYLEVRRSNEAARGLYHSSGFEEAFVREGYYGDEDAIVMRLVLNDREF